uniref:Uncharacterized protein n=1 Tax=Macaca mulatta TaxID=9544 RepID=A0A5F8AKM4_MACMU
MVSWARPRDTAPHIPATLAPTMAQSGPGTGRATASESVSYKPWQLPRGVKPAGVQSARVEAWKPPPRFQKKYVKAWMSRQKPAVGLEPSWRTSTRAVWRGNVGLEPQHRVPTGALPRRAVRRRPLFSRPQNGRSTGNLHLVPGKASGSQHQLVRETVETELCKAKGEETPNALGAHLLHQCTLDVRHGVKGDHFGALRCNDCPVGFQNSMGPVAPSFGWFLSFGTVVLTQCLYPHCLGVTNLLMVL